MNKRNLLYGLMFLLLVINVSASSTFRIVLSTGNVDINNSLMSGTKLNWSDILNPPTIPSLTGYNTTVQLTALYNTLYYPLGSNPAGYLTSYIDSTARVDSLNLTKLNVTDQRYNDTGFCSALVSSVGNWTLDKSSYNTTAQLYNIFLNITDQRYNDTAYINGKFGTLDDNKWCIGDGGKVVCETNAPVLTESDPIASPRIDSLNLTKGNASTGVCTGSQVVQNVTTTGVNCITPTASIDGTTIVNMVGNWSLDKSSYNTAVQDAVQDQTYKMDRRVPAYLTDFYSVTAVYNTPWVLGAIASGTAPLIAGEPNHPGIVQFTSSTTASSGYTYNIAGATTYSLGGNETTQMTFRPYTKLTTLVNLTNIKFGFTDVITGADAVDGVYFNITQLSTSNTTLQVALIGSSNSARVTNISGTTISNNTWYTAQIWINNTALATGVIYNEDGTELLRLTVSTVPNGASRQTSQSVLCWVNGGTTAVKLCDVDYLSVGYFNPMRR